MNKENLLKAYESRKEIIRSRLKELQEIKNLDDKRIFKELAFCLCVPQSKAKLCWDAVNEMDSHGCLWNGNTSELLTHMGKVRYSSNKAKWIENARNMFSEGGQIAIKSKLTGDPRGLREWLVENVHGMGYKLATHFLRNVGIHQHMAILDVHILSNLLKYGVIDEIPKTLTKKKYLEIEKKMEEFSKEIGIPMDELDLLFWSEQTGYVFK